MAYRVNYGNGTYSDQIGSLKRCKQHYEYMLSRFPESSMEMLMSDGSWIPMKQGG